MCCTWFWHSQKRPELTCPLFQSGFVFLQRHFLDFRLQDSHYISHFLNWEAGREFLSTPNRSRWLFPWVGHLTYKKLHQLKFWVPLHNFGIQIDPFRVTLTFLVECPYSTDSEVSMRTYQTFSQPPSYHFTSMPHLWLINFFGINKNHPTEQLCW